MVKKHAGLLVTIPSKIFTGVPRLLRCDYGTENCDLAYIQPFFRRNHNDSRSRLSSFRYGRSTSNQVCIYIYIYYI